MTRRYGFNINGRGNGIWLPAGPDVPGGEHLTIHFLNHPVYTDFVRSRLDQLWYEYSRGGIAESQILRRFEDVIGEFEAKLGREAFGELTTEGRIHVK